MKLLSPPPAPRAARLDSPEQRSREHLARTLRRAAEIANAKAAHSRRQARKLELRRRRFLAAGISLLILGVVGSLLALFSGLADLVGVTVTSAAGLGSVALGAAILAFTPQPNNGNDSYAHNAQQLERLSRRLG